MPSLVNFSLNQLKSRKGTWLSVHMFYVSPIHRCCQRQHVVCGCPCSSVHQPRTETPRCPCWAPAAGQEDFWRQQMFITSLSSLLQPEYWRNTLILQDRGWFTPVPIILGQILPSLTRNSQRDVTEKGSLDSDKLKTIAVHV